MVACFTVHNGFDIVVSLLFFNQLIMVFIEVQESPAECGWHSFVFRKMEGLALMCLRVPPPDS